MRISNHGLEQYLLQASGLAAIGLVVWITYVSTGSWSALVAQLAFAGLFLVLALDERLGLPTEYAAWALVLMLMLVLLSLNLFPETVTLILAVVLAATAPYHLRPSRSWGLLLMGNTLFFLLLLAKNGNTGFFPGYLTLLALQAFAISSSQARCREDLIQRQLARQNNEILASRAIMAQQSRSDERLRIAGDLHDTIGHELTALRLQLEALQHQVPVALQSDIANSKSLAGEILEDVRRIVREIPTAQSEDLRRAVDELAEMTPAVSIEVDGPLPEVEAPLLQQLVFCVQEAISNALRHGRADQIKIAYADSTLVISDNGTGLTRSASTPGFGLNNIKKRIEHFGGSMTLTDRSDGDGCELMLKFAPGSVIV
ncbi:MAG: histidine kinase [Pseudomonadota bacterium]